MSNAHISSMRRIVDLVDAGMTEAVSVSSYRGYHAIPRPTEMIEAVKASLASHASFTKGQRFYFDLASDYDSIELDGAIARQVAENFRNTASDFGYFKLILGIEKDISSMLLGLKDPSQDSGLYSQYQAGIIIDGNGRPNKIGKLIRSCIKMAQKNRDVVTSDVAENPTGNIRNYRGLGFDALVLNELIDEIIASYRKNLRDFENDPSRSSSDWNTSQYKVVVSTHPYDLVGSSTGRGWYSCLNVNDGSESNYLTQYVANGALTAYLIRSTDLNIENPVSRTLLVPAHLSEEEDSPYIYVSQDTYGHGSRVFSMTVQEILSYINGVEGDGIYTVRRGNQYPLRYQKTGNTIGYADR